MEDEKVIDQQETKAEEKIVPEEMKTEQKQDKQEVKEDKKIDTKEEGKQEKEEKRDDNYSALELRLKALEEDNKLKAEELNSQKIKNSILEKIGDKDLQKEVLASGLVKSADDIEKVMKILELSKSLNKSKFTDGYKPQDTVQTDAYQQAQSKGNVLDMIKQKMSKQQ